MAKNTESFIADNQLVSGVSFKSGSEYRLIERLGRGGMGEVWLAERKSAAGHVHSVAIKYLTDPDSGQESLAVEALRMSRLNHDNIVPFVDSGIDEAGRFFVAMAFVQGVDLDGLRKMIGIDSDSAYGRTSVTRIPDKIVGFIMFMTLRALEYAHNFEFGNGVVGLIHRDISPGNVLIDVHRGFIKLSDFGVAAVQDSESSCGQIAGKVPYMAPEVLVEEAIDARADIYALGLVAYELLTGFNPNIQPCRSYSIIGAITEVMLALDQPLVPPHGLVSGIDPKLSTIIMDMLKRDRFKRYPTAHAVLDDLSVYLFDRGFGPTTGSMSSYMTLIKNPEIEPTEQIKRSLRFLDWSRGIQGVRPRWILTPEAKESLLNGKNPARLYD